MLGTGSEDLFVNVRTVSGEKMALEKPASQVRVAGAAGARCSLPGLDFFDESVMKA